MLWMYSSHLCNGIKAVESATVVMASLSFFDLTWIAFSFWITFTFEETLSHSLPLFSVSIMFVAICYSFGTWAYWDEYFPAVGWPTYVMSSIAILSLLVLAKSSILIGVCLLTVKILRFRGEHSNAWHIFTAVVLIFMVTQAVVLLWFLLTSDTCCAYPVMSLHFYAYCWSRWEGTTLYSCQASLFLRGWAVVGDIIYLYPWASFISHLLGSRCFFKLISVSTRWFVICPFLEYSKIFCPPCL